MKWKLNNAAVFAFIFVCMEFCSVCLGFILLKPRCEFMLEFNCVRIQVNYNVA